MGMLSYGLIGSWQCGQCEAGNAIDSPLGMRWMQTLRKLPTRAPNTNTANVSISGPPHPSRAFYPASRVKSTTF